jgi:hypothetical protein
MEPLQQIIIAATAVIAFVCFWLFRFYFMALFRRLFRHYTIDVPADKRRRQQLAKNPPKTVRLADRHDSETHAK